MRQEMLQWERNRRLVEETEKLNRIAREKEEAKKKRGEAVAKKSLEEEAATILAGGSHPSCYTLRTHHCNKRRNQRR